MTAGSRLLVRVAPFGVLAGLAIDLAGGRWGAYIATPVPDLYLADALWGLGCLAAVAGLATLRRLSRTVVVAALLCAAYVVVRFLAAALASGTQTSLIIRDLAPFAYLAFVPLAAAALSTVGVRTFVWLLRVSTAVLAVGCLVLGTGVSTAGLGDLLGGPTLAAMVFPGRLDVVGVILGIGVIAWGRFPGYARPVRIVQFVLVVVALSNDSQAAELVVALAVVWAVWRERAGIRGWLSSPTRVVLAILIAVGLLVAVVAATLALRVASGSLRVVGPSPAPSVTTPASVAPPTTAASTPATTAPEGDQQPSATPTPSQSTAPSPSAETTSTGFDRTDRLDTATARARLETYGDVLGYVGHGGRWLVGTGIGTPATLLEACGYTLAEYQADSHQNKCGVDSGNQSTPLRDPHDWALFLLLYHGLVGIVLFVGALAAYWWRPPREPVLSVTAVPVVLYAVAATVGVIFSSPFGLLPLATFTAYALSRRLASAAESRESTAAQVTT